MLSKNDFPVLEFDDTPTAKLNPITEKRPVPCENPLMIYRYKSGGY